MTKEKQNGHAWALLPLLLFVLLFLGVGIISGDFTTMPLNVAITVTVVVALLMNRKERFAKIEVFTKSAGHSNIILMMLIFILAGAFRQPLKKWAVLHRPSI